MYLIYFKFKPQMIKFLNRYSLVSGRFMDIIKKIFLFIIFNYFI